MTTLGDLYVDIHANTGVLKKEVGAAARTLDKEGTVGGQQFSKGFEKETNRSMGRFERDFKTSVGKALTNLPDIVLDADSSDVDRKIVSIRNRLLDLRDKKIGIDISAEDALAHMGVIRADLEALAAKDINIDVDVNTKGALAHLTAFTAILPEFSSGAGGAAGAATRLGFSAGGMGASFAASLPIVLAIGAGIIALVGAAGAAGGALGGLALALAAPLGAAGAGGGLFALLAGKYISQTNKVLKQIEDLKKAGKTGEADALIARLSNAQKAYMKAREGLSSAFKSFVTKNDSALLTPFTDGINLLSKVLKGSGLSALIREIGNSIDGFIKSISAKSIDNALHGFADLISKGHVLDSIFSSLKSFGGIFSSIFGAGADLGSRALGAMADGLQRFNRYLKSDEGKKQLKEFFDWVAQHGPEIGKDFVDIGVGLYKFVKAMVPAGLATLKFLGWLGKLQFLAPVVKIAMGGVVLAFAGIVGAIGLVIGAIGGISKAFALIPGAPPGAKKSVDAMLHLSKETLSTADAMGKLGLGVDTVNKKHVKIPVDADTKDAHKHIKTAQDEATKPQTFTLDAKKGKDTDSKITGWKAGWKSPVYVNILAEIKKFGSGWTSSWFTKFLGGVHGAEGIRIPAGYAGGGKVPGITPSNRRYDNVRAMTAKGNPLRVQSGEWIINSRSSQQNDRLLAAINAGFNAQMAYGFSGGGVVRAEPKQQYSGGGRVSEAATIQNIQHIKIDQNNYGPQTGAEKQREIILALRYGTRFGSAAGVK